MPTGVYLRTDSTKKKISKVVKNLWRNSAYRKMMVRLHKGKFIGSKNPSWKGGKIKDKDGYIHVKKRNHPFSNKNGYIREHRLVMEKKIGRYLHRWEIVHHINNIPTDNRISNLMLLPNRSKHEKLHYRKPRKKMLKIVVEKRRR